MHRIKHQSFLHGKSHFLGNNQGGSIDQRDKFDRKPHSFHDKSPAVVTNDCATSATRLP